MRRAVGDYEIDDDPARIDPKAAVSFLTTPGLLGPVARRAGHLAPDRRVLARRGRL
jgi:hypothetical protein